MYIIYICIYCLKEELDILSLSLVLFLDYESVNLNLFY